jgi:hypothetical protein
MWKKVEPFFRERERKDLNVFALKKLLRTAVKNKSANQKSEIPFRLIVGPERKIKDVCPGQRFTRRCDTN